MVCGFQCGEQMGSGMRDPKTMGGAWGGVHTACRLFLWHHPFMWVSGLVVYSCGQTVRPRR